MNKISVVLMVYNRNEYYREALDSLKEQSDRDFELIIVSNIPIDYDLSAFKGVQEGNECQLWIYNGNQGGVVSEIIHRIIHDDMNIFLSEDHT